MKTYIVIFSLFLSSSLVQAKPFSLGFIGDAGKATQNAMTVRDSMIRGTSPASQIMTIPLTLLTLREQPLTRWVRHRSAD